VTAAFTKPEPFSVPVIDVPETVPVKLDAVYPGEASVREMFEPEKLPDTVKATVDVPVRMVPFPVTVPALSVRMVDSTTEELVVLNEPCQLPFTSARTGATALDPPQAVAPASVVRVRASSAWRAVRAMEGKEKRISNLVGVGVCPF
jgi:hypothetical protein